MTQTEVNGRFRERLTEHRVIAILRAPYPTYFVDVCQVLYNCGVPVIEAALTTPGVTDVIASIRRALPEDALVGVGSVRTVTDVDSAAAAGARFLVSPNFRPDVLARATGHGLPVVCGALTPTEIENAWHAGAAAVKIFPISEVGGVRYLKAIRAPMPDIPLVPTGGVTSANADAYLAAGAFGVAAGSALVGDSVKGGDLEGLAQRATEIASTVGRYT